VIGLNGNDLKRSLLVFVMCYVCNYNELLRLMHTDLRSVLSSCSLLPFPVPLTGSLLTFNYYRRCPQVSEHCGKMADESTFPQSRYGVTV
jgi:hypothetical protein